MVEEGVQLLIVKLGFIGEASCPTMSDYDVEENKIKISSLAVVYCISKECKPVMSLVQERRC